MADGAQVIPPDDASIAEAAASRRGASSPMRGGRRGRRGQSTRRSCSGRTGARCSVSSTRPGPRRLEIVYTPMHGVGGAVLPGSVRAGRLRAGLGRRRPGRARPGLPDGRLSQPRGARRARSRARRRRCGSMPTSCSRTIPTPTASPSPCPTRRAGPGGVLTGDELGVLLADHVLAATSGDDRLVATTIVSSTMLSKMAEAAGVAYRRDAHRLQVDRESGAAPPGAPARLRLRGGARLRGGRCRRRQGRSVGRARRGGDRGTCQGARGRRWSAGSTSSRAVSGCMRPRSGRCASRARRRRARWPRSSAAGGATRPSRWPASR